MAERQSPEYVRISQAAAITLGLSQGRFYRDARLHAINVLLTYDDGCMGRCAYCGLAGSRTTDTPWTRHSFIRVDWPIVNLSEVTEGIDSCPHVERACVSMVTHPKARQDCLTVVERLREKLDAISALITPTIVNREWLDALRDSGADKVGIAIDAATPRLFEELRGRSLGGPHGWEKYWQTVEEAVEIFGQHNVGVHLIVGLGETEEQTIRAIQKAHNLGALTHLFSFFPEKGSLMENHPQPPIGQYRRVQLARYLINKGLADADAVRFDGEGRIVEFEVGEKTLGETVASGLPFMTSGCAGKSGENACNRPFSDYTPYQALVGEMRNYPFHPTEDDVALIKRHLRDYSRTPVKVWIQDGRPSYEDNL